MLNSDLALESRNRDKDIAGMTNLIEENLTKINEASKLGNVEREESDADLLKQIGEGLQNLSQRVLVERQSRESSEQAVYDLLKDVVGRVKVLDR
jgi:hypothetical protein